MKALDLYCGLGGWSDGLVDVGFEVLGVELRQDLADLYQHSVIVADVRNLDPTDFEGYDLIVGSPPCRDFSAQARCAFREGNPWKIPPDPEGLGLDLVNTFLRFVKIAKPQNWLMENVVNLTKYLELSPIMKVRIAGGKQRCFWGNFPLFLVTYHPEIRMHYTGKLRSEKNAYIPREIGRSLGLAIIQGNEVESDIEL
ncbi:hypothetical protein LCGC14_1147750 [marine sediment metagenome]|uniref:DNA (cytosine-5-)-methyltransferase n=1 Tax=marine sediment metagenome TaxID=412755 RepID=A0A0F9M1C2_9ZZZZ